MSTINCINNQTTFQIPFQNISKLNKLYETEFHNCLSSVLQTGNLILGNNVLLFETEFAKYIDIKYCLGVNSCTSALELAIESLSLSNNDIVLVQANTYIATILSSRNFNITIKIVDVDNNGNIDINKVEELISITKVKVILVTHLYGDCCDMFKLTEICKKNDIYIIEDCAQGCGTTINNKKLGSFGDISCFSFYPSKNLGCLGDGGAICTNNQSLYNKLMKMRNLGSIIKYKHELKGTNSRLDALQSLFLLVKLPDIDKHILYKQQLSQIYNNNLDKRYFKHLKNDMITIQHSYHVYIVELININRNDLMKFMAINGIETIIHYPEPFYKSNAYLEFNNLTFEITEHLANNIISFPINPILTENEILYICEIANKFNISIIN